MGVGPWRSAPLQCPSTMPLPPSLLANITHRPYIHTKSSISLIREGVVEEWNPSIFPLLGFIFYLKKKKNLTSELQMHQNVMFAKGKYDT